MAFRFLLCLAKAVAKHSGKFLAEVVPGGEALYEIAADAWQDFHQQSNEGALRGEVEALAQAPLEKVRQQAQAALAQDPSLSPQARQAAIDYLSQVPAMIRRSLRRPSDPSGTTAPAGLDLRRPQDLLAFLPPRPPRFKAGEQPLPGIDWVLEELVGIGGFGEVWKARHAHLRSKPPAALKFCLDPSAVASLRNEAGVLDRVMQHGKHPGIVPLWNTYLSAATPCLEYEFIEGGDLASLIRELHAAGKLRPETANRLFLHLVKIVAFAHQAEPAIVHGDLKPANVLVQRKSDGNLELRVTDFGIGGIAAARAAKETRQPTRSRQELLTEAVRGAYTPLYASPEQMLRRPGESLDPRDDVHALGVIWYQLLTGDLAMTSVPPEWREEVQKRRLGKELIALLGSCIAQKAEKRPDNAATLASKLRSLLAPSTPPALPTPPTPPAPSAKEGAPVLSRRVVLGGILVGVGGVSCLGVGALVSWKAKEKDKEAKAPEEKGKKPADPVDPKKPVVQQPQPPTAWNTSRPGAVSTNSLGMKFAFVPRGRFWMGGGGGTPGDKEVTIPHDFFLGVYEVTQAQWLMLMDSNPSCFSRSGEGKDRVKDIPDGELAQFPVENVSWDLVQEFLKKLNAKEKDSEWLYRLPTEAEWEYSCRGGASSKQECSFHFYFDKPTDDLSFDDANFDGSHPVGNGKQGPESKRTTTVGSYKPNRLGLYDMHGNVWEWCDDLYEGSWRVVRGGSASHLGAYCQAAYRSRLEPSGRYNDLGCRLARVPVG